MSAAASESLCQDDVLLLRYCKTERGWRRYPAAVGRNGRIRSGYALVSGEPVLYAECHYEIGFYKVFKPVYRNVGETHKMLCWHATGKRNRWLRGMLLSLAEEAGRIPLSRQATKFVQAAEERDAIVVSKAYRLAIDEFLSQTGRTYADQVTADDLAGHHLALKRARV
jgi:hypothetical protein